MYLQEKNYTEITVAMNDSVSNDEFSVSMSENVIRAYYGLARAMGKENKIEAVKFIRSQFVGCGLRFAKAFVEDSCRD